MDTRMVGSQDLKRALTHQKLVVQQEVIDDCMVFCVQELKILKHALTDPELVMRQEVTMLRGLSYDTNVVQFYGSCIKDGKILLVLEYMEVSHWLYMHGTLGSAVSCSK